MSRPSISTKPMAGSETQTFTSTKLLSTHESRRNRYTVLTREPRRSCSSFWRRCCAVCRGKMRHLVCVRLHKARAGGSARNIVTTGGISRQPVEPIDEPQHVRHCYVCDGKGPGQPFASCQHRLEVLQPALEEPVQTFPCRRITAVTGERQYGPGQARHLD